MKYLTLRLFLWSCSILRDEDASVLPSTTATATSTTSAQSANTVPLVVGLTLGLLAFIALVFAGIFYRRRKASTAVDAHTTLPTMQVNPFPEPSGPAGTYAAIVSGGTTASFDGNELGPPPSYGGSVHGGSVHGGIVGKNA